MIRKASGPSCSVCHFPTLFSFKSWISPDSGVQHEVVVVPETAREHTLFGASFIRVCVAGVGVGGRGGK